MDFGTLSNCGRIMSADKPEAKKLTEANKPNCLRASESIKSKQTNAAIVVKQLINKELLISVKSFSILDTFLKWVKM